MNKEIVLIYRVLLLVIISGSMFAASAVEPIGDEIAARQEALERGEARLKSILALHALSVPYDSSKPYANPKNSFRGHIEGVCNEKENMPLNNLHRDVISIFERSEFLANQYAPQDNVVCEGTQLLQDLEILTGKVGSENACVLSSLVPAETASCFGKVSAALLLSQPVLKKTLFQRQSMLRYLTHDDQGEVYDHLTLLFSKITASQRYLIPEILGGKNYRSGERMGLLLLMLPFLKKFKEHPLGKTVDDIYSKGASLYWALLLAPAALRMAAYGVQALRADDSSVIEPNYFLPDEKIKEYKNQADMYTSPDIKFMWKYGPDSLKIKALFSFVAAGFCGYWFVKNITDYYYPQWLIFDKLDWQWLSRAVDGLSAMKEVYTCIAHNDMIRSLPDCAPVYDFFEKKVKEDAELHDLMSLVESVPLDSVYGNYLFSGYTSKFRTLLQKKSTELSDLVVGIGRIEAYLCFARLLKQGGGESAANEYCFPTYTVDDEPAVFNAAQLWNAALAREKAISSDVALGGNSKVRNYLITGANAAGKSTFLKSIGIGALLGQTIGIVPAKSCHMSVFSILETYLNITDDIQQGNSLFKKEVMRAAALLKRADAAEGKPVLFIFDEMFSGTTPHEGISCATSVAEHIVQMPNVLSCIATHYMYLVKLTHTYQSIVNKCVRLTYDTKQAKYVRTYRLQDGISDQHVALDMLGEEGVDGSIVVNARKVLRDIEENGVGA